MLLLAVFLTFLALWWTAQPCNTAQVPLINHSSQPSPLNDDFEKVVNSTLDHFRTPGLAIAVVRGNETFVKVSSSVASAMPVLLTTTGLWGR